MATTPVERETLACTTSTATANTEARPRETASFSPGNLIGASSNSVGCRRWSDMRPSTGASLADVASSSGSKGVIVSWPSQKSASHQGSRCIFAVIITNEHEKGDGQKIIAIS
ncbi:hypothetical protein CGMCC3_g11483 [Colletotrichum fructicola]|uniref:Uncharacterized protein n=1 Tax=Colletotrichum fructicola (strain Nara gc5) TaxID=1213859 RepID=L2FP69_COLFN|nr:uncharacterized protein CGMCC3_g11483 [Colletotrichum fructicola]KAE9572439.1 hypothetical protein CGMCC3_g11483 [Colletotrichum fructicola]